MTAARIAALATDAGHWDEPYPAGLIRSGNSWLIPGRQGTGRWIAIGFPGHRPPAWLTPLDPAHLPDGATPIWRDGATTVWLRRWDTGVMRTLQAGIPWLRPQRSGGRPSVGLGDRIGLATPGHLAGMKGTGLFPVVAQQSIREMTRTQRTPEDVMADAVWGVLICGWRTGFGADADHLKTIADVDATADAGFVLFTLDGTDVIGHRELTGRTPAARWGRAVNLFTTLARRAIRRTHGRCELEISLDELPFDTDPADHRYVVTVLRNRGLRIHQIAPRFPGAFEKAIDYRGDRSALDRSIAAHATICREYGHTLSIHSGSDKFAVYPLVAKHTHGRFHLKTAGTWYLEALRGAARKDPELFREIAIHSKAAFAKDRATYHISAKLSRVPDPRRTPDRRLESAFLKPDDPRQVLHVGFGSVLTARTPSGWRFRDRLLDLLIRHDRLHRALVARHLSRHIHPLLH